MSLFAGEKPVLGPTTIKNDGSAKAFVVQKADGTELFSVSNTAGTVSVNSAKLIGTETIAFQMTASSVDCHVWVAPFACKVVSVREIHSVVGGAAAAVRLRKITDTSSPGAAASSTVKELTTAAFDLTATINTTQVGTLSATASDYTLAAGDKISADFSGTLTGLVGMVTVEVQAV